jgi:uncharacterized protein YacL
MQISPGLIKTLLGLIFAVMGFVLSNPYFSENPLFEIIFLAQTLIGICSGILAYFLLPIIGFHIKNWFETLIAKTVSRIVSDFWTQQTKRIQKARRDRQKEQARKEKEKKLKEQRAKPIVLDTSAIIDGRILDIAKIGFLDNPLVISQFVLDELQRIADSSNNLKRGRGRRGLELLEEAKKSKGVKIEVKEYSSREKDVDKKLVSLAKKIGGKVATVDFNLNKVASVSGVKVLNVNELSNAVKTVVIPGEKLKIKIIQEGKESHQGVGYLEDGTMVVVEQGRELIGQTAEVEVSRILQTAAGKMIFAQK